jgi:hypothetical protein
LNPQVFIVLRQKKGYALYSDGITPWEALFLRFKEREDAFYAI